MRSLFWYSNKQWAAIEPHLPNYAAGKRREDDRRIVMRYGKNAQNCSAPGSLDTSLSHAAGLIEIAACHA